MRNHHVGAAGTLFLQLTTNSPTLLTSLTVVSFLPTPTGSSIYTIFIIMITNMVASVFVFYNVCVLTFFCTNKCVWTQDW